MTKAEEVGEVTAGPDQGPLAPTTVRPRLFLGFEYRDPSLTLFGNVLPEAVAEHGWVTVMPLGGRAGGLMLDRILAMIKLSERCVFEVSQPNGNVWFELGVAVALRLPTAVSSRVAPENLDPLLRGVFLHVHKNDAACLAQVAEFLRDSRPSLIAERSVPQEPDSRLVRVVGDCERAGAASAGLEAKGFKVERIAPAVLGSLTDSIGFAEGCFACVVVEPPGQRGEWARHAVGPLTMLGAAHALGRRAVLAAQRGDVVPSDCYQLLASGSDTTSMVEAVIGRVMAPRPSPPPSGIGRPHLAGTLPRDIAEKLKSHFQTDRLAFLDAEPGYGKTTTAVQVSELLGWPLAWVTINSEWGVVQIVERLVAALEVHALGFGWNTLLTLREGTDASADGRNLSPDLPARQESLTPESLASLFIRDSESAVAPPRVLLIIDDIHRASGAVGRFVASVAMAAPSWMALLIAGRSGPDAITSIAASGKLPTWRSEELSFTIGETRDFMRHKLAGLPDDYIDLLFRRTQGWPAALAVIRLWLEAHSEASLDDLEKRTRGDREQIYSVFAGDYFEGLAANTRTDLLELAVPMILTSAEAEFLFGSGGGLKLRKFATEAYFLTEEETDTYRYHSLFREFLVQRWREERGAQSLQAARTKMAAWYLDQNNPAAAYQMACDAESWDLAEKALGPMVRILAYGGDSAMLRSLLERLPIGRIRQSRLLLEGWVRALSQTGAPQALQEGERLLSMEGGTPTDRGLAELLVAQIKLDLGTIDQAAFGQVMAEMAARLQEADPKLAIQARQQSLSARAIHSIDPSEWTSLAEESVEIATRANELRAFATEAVAKAEAGELLWRIWQFKFQRLSTATAIRHHMGVDLTPAARVTLATELKAVADRSLELIKEAKAIADRLQEPLVQAIVQLIYARVVSLAAMTSVFEDQALTAEARERGEQAIALALGAAKEYAERGVVRSVAIAYNSAAQAAAIINDKANRDRFSQHAEELASRAGYDDLVQAARRIRSHPTPLESIAEATAHNRPSRGQLPDLANAMLQGADVSPEGATLARPVLISILQDQFDSEEKNRDVCRHLCLVYQDTGPLVEGFHMSHPRRRAVCRLRGIVTVNSADQGAPLVNKFIDDFCATCDLRSPGQPSTPAEGGDENIFKPLIERLRQDQARS